MVIKQTYEDVEKNVGEEVPQSQKVLEQPYEERNEHDDLELKYQYLYENYLYHPIKYQCEQVQT